MYASFRAFESARESASCVAELAPPVMFLPAVEEGELPLTAFWSLSARAPAHCSVLASWAPAWKPPAPPLPLPEPPLQPQSWLSRLSFLQPQPEPTFWVWFCVWLV